jgi:hypothetical protein
MSAIGIIASILGLIAVGYIITIIIRNRGKSTLKDLDDEGFFD